MPMTRRMPGLRMTLGRSPWNLTGPTGWGTVQLGIELEEEARDEWLERLEGELEETTSRGGKLSGAAIR